MEKINKIQAAIKKGVLNNKEYTLKVIDAPVKLNQNESPYDLPKAIKNKILKKLGERNWNIYPDFIPQRIYEKAAEYFKLKPSNILMGNGSNEMIFTILAATMEKGKTIVLPQPIFTVYGLIAGNLNAAIKNVMLNRDFSFNVPEIIKGAKMSGSVTVLCSPNNPTGTYLKVGQTKEIIEASGGIVVVDEAYIHFGGESVLDYIKKYDNLIVLRTFSKMFGLAGLRIGIMLSNEKIITHLSKVKLPYNLNILTISALETILDNGRYINDNIILINEQKEILEKVLKSIKEIDVTDSAANFFLIRVKDSKWLFNMLLSFGVLVRDVSGYPMLENCLRISIGDKKQNSVLIKALNKIYNIK